MSDEEEDDDLPDFSNDPTFTGINSYTIIYTHCPKCEKRNYFQQATRYDIEVLECWNCGTRGWVCDDVRDEAQLMYDCMDAAMDEKGKKEP